MKAILLCLLLAGCATAPPREDCLSMTKPQLVRALQSAWNDGWAKGYDTGEDNAPPSCRRTI